MTVRSDPSLECLDLAPRRDSQRRWVYEVCGCDEAGGSLWAGRRKGKKHSAGAMGARVSSL